MTIIHAVNSGAEFIQMFPLQLKEIMEVFTEKRFFYDLADEWHVLPSK